VGNLAVDHLRGRERKVTEAEFEKEIASGTKLANWIEAVMVRECSRRKWIREELVGAIHLGLVQAYLKFDGRGHFTGFACRMIKWRIVDMKRRVLKHCGKEVGLAELEEERGLELENGEGPVGWELEWEDEVRAVFGKPTNATRRDHELAVGRFLVCGMDRQALGAEQGRDPERVWKRMKESARERVKQWGAT
jgi:DNA-directed RNA polymerase specialized sigma24 family protein